MTAQDSRPPERGASPGTAPAVTVIVVSFNTRDLVRRCLTSVREQGVTPLETIVVDNASADGTAQMVRDEFPGVIVIANTDNRGFAAANNQALAIARGTFALLLNPDTEVMPQAIDSTLAFAGANTDAAVIACRVLDSDGRQHPTLFRTPRLRDVFFDVFIPIRLARRFSLLGYQRYAGLDLERVHDVETVTGCFMLVRREAWMDAGVLDEDFFIYGEETEWCHRLRRHGWKVRYFPGASIVHHGGASTAQLRTAMNLSLTRSILLLIQKTRGRPTAYAANVLMLVREAPRGAAHLCLRALHVKCSPRTMVSLEHSASRFVLHARGLARTDWAAEARRPPQQGSATARQRLGTISK